MMTYDDIIINNLLISNLYNTVCKKLSSGFFNYMCLYLILCVFI